MTSKKRQAPSWLVRSSQQAHFFAAAVLLVSFIRPGTAQTIPSSQLEQREGIWYEVDADSPFTGEVSDPGELEGKVENGKRSGRWTAYHDNGNTYWVTDYDEGVSQYHAMYYPSGNMLAEVHFQEGRRHGSATRWYPSGAKSQERTYNQGKQDGAYKLWDPDNNLLYEATYVEGEIDGPAIWWFDNGQKRWATNYTQGKRSGEWTQWTKKGEIMSKTNWEEGKMISRTHGLHQHH